MSSGLAPLNSTMLAVAIPSIAKSFDHSASTVTHALVTSYLLGSIALQSPGGKLGDRVGYRRALSLGQWVFLAGTVLGLAAPEIVTLAVSRVVMAAGGAIIVPSATALLRTELPADRRGRAFGMFGATMGLSAMLGPLVGGALEARFGFRALFVANIPVLVVSALLARTAVATTAPAAPSPDRPRPRLDWKGTVMLAAALSALVVGSKLHGAARGATMAGGVGIMIPFVVHELRTTDPVMDLRLLSERAIACGASITALHNLSMYALLFLLPNLLDVTFGLSSSQTARIVITMMAAMVVVAPVAGRLADRFGPRALALAGCALALAGMVVLRLTRLDAPSSLIPALLLLGVGLGLSSPPSQAAAMSAAPREKSGMAAGMLSTLRYVGGVGGIMALAFVAATERTHEAAIAELYAAANVFIVACVVALVLAAGLPKVTPRDPAK